MANIPFSVSARTARLIGRENVANAEGALIELVKNCYDADSENAMILIDKKLNRIVIMDTGEGMHGNIITEQWMTIGTDDKLYNAITSTGRIKSGAKGIGRFALDRLGEKCTMLTFPKNGQNGFKWIVDWNQFEEKDQKGRNVKINDVYAQLNEIENSNYKSEIEKVVGDNNILEIINGIDIKKPITHGTCLIIENLRDKWSDTSVSKVFQTLELLNPPEGLSKINIWLLSSDEPGKYGLVSNDEFLDYDYKLVARYKKNDEYNIDIEVNRNEFDINLIPRQLFDFDEMKEFPYDFESFQKEKFHLNRTFHQLLKVSADKTGLFKNIGDFEFTFYFLKKTMQSENQEKYYYKSFLGNRANWIEKFGGIKLYRDDFRIRPYGELNTQAYDWLMLGERFGQNPAGFSRRGSRVRPNQVAGVVKLSRIDNPHLEDTSNREGIQNSDTFELFKNLLIGIIRVQEDDRSTIGFNLDRLFSLLNETENDITESEEIANEKPNLIETPEEIKQKNEKLKRGVKAISQKLVEKEDELATSRAMASAGIMISSFSHEFHGIKNNLTSRIFLLKNKLNSVLPEDELKTSQTGVKLLDEIEKLYKQDQKIKQWIEFAIGLTKKNRRTNKLIDFVEYFNQFEKTWNENLFLERNISFSVNYIGGAENTYKTKISELDLDTIFDNLITNSIEAFQKAGVSGDRTINIQIELENNWVKVTYSDNGPGIDSTYLNINKIFIPFETSKNDDLGNPIGTGLGMWLVKSAIDSNKGKVLLSKPSKGFKIEFWFKN
jgi:signal transduction histidine kinase